MEVEKTFMVEVQSWVEQRDEIREELREFHDPRKGKKLRGDLKAFADIYYQQKYTMKEHFEFIKTTISSFSLDSVGNQSQNSRCNYVLFTCESQHVHGDCLEELIDNAIDEAKIRAIYEKI